MTDETAMDYLHALCAMAMCEDHRIRDFARNLLAAIRAKESGRDAMKRLLEEHNDRHEFVAAWKAQVMKRRLKR